MIRAEAAIAALCLGVLVGFVAGATLRNNPEPRVIRVQEPCSAPTGFVWQDGEQSFRVLFERDGFKAVHDPGVAARLAGVK